MTTSRNTWEEDGVDDEADIIIRRQDEIAVYRNDRGDVVIRQSSWPDDDVLVILAAEHAERLAHALRRCAAEIMGDDDDDGDRDADAEQSPKPRRKAPMTAAERKRRQRDMQRDVSRNDVTRERDKRDTNGTAVDLPFSPPIDPKGEEEEVPAD